MIHVYADIDTIGNKKGTNEMVIKMTTQEIPDDDAAELMKLRNKFCAVLFKPGQDDVTDEETKVLPDEFSVAPTLDNKSPSQRLRSTIFRAWESRYKLRYPDFDSFYERQIELLIDQWKDKI